MMTSNLPPVVAVIIVSFNTRQQTIECLKSVMAELTAVPAEIYVVDNASIDDSVAAITAEFPSVKIIANTVNVGFGRANNQAILRSTAPLLFLLNSDAFPLPGAIASLLKFMAEHPRAAVTGPRLVNIDGSLQPSCYKFPSPLRATFEHTLATAAMPNAPVVGDYRKWNHDADRRVDFVSGACLLVRRSTVDQVGMFDENFFLYCEEVDWCKRFATAGWETWFTPTAVVRHVNGGSGNAQPDAVFDEFHRGQERYFRKHHGTIGLAWYRLMIVIGSLLRMTLRPGNAGPWWRLLKWTVGFRGPGLNPAFSHDNHASKSSAVDKHGMTSRTTDNRGAA